MYNWDLSNQRVFKEQIEERKKKGDFKWRLQTRGRQKHSRRVVIGASASSRDFRSYTNNVKGNLSYAEARVLRIDADRDRRLLDKAQRDRLFHRNLRRKQREQQLRTNTRASVFQKTSIELPSIVFKSASAKLGVICAKVKSETIIYDSCYI